MIKCPNSHYPRSKTSKMCLVWVWVTSYWTKMAASPWLTKISRLWLLWSPRPRRTPRGKGTLHLLLVAEEEGEEGVEERRLLLRPRLMVGVMAGLQLERRGEAARRGRGEMGRSRRPQ